MDAPDQPSTIVLRDGRRLAYRALGPPGGELVVYLHGAIGSPQAGCPELDAVLADLDVRYVMVSRPGFRGSDPLPGRTLRGFAGDVAQLADALGHERFAVVGVSAGGPYALACAHELAERVLVAAVVSCMTAGEQPPPGLPRPARVALRALRGRPRGCSRVGDALLRIGRAHPALVARVIRAGAVEADRRSGDESQADTAAAARFLAATGDGVGAIVEDHLLVTSPWGFQPAGVGPLVQLWHGMQDPLVPVGAALGLAASLQRVQTALDPDEGHFFYRRRLREILGDVVAVTDRAARPRPAPQPAAPPGRADPRAVPTSRSGARPARGR